MIKNNKRLRKKLVSQIALLILAILLVPTIIIIMLIYQNINYNNLIKNNIGKEIQQMAKVYATNIQNDIQKYSTLFDILPLITEPNGIISKHNKMDIKDILIYDNYNDSIYSLNKNIEDYKQNIDYRNLKLGTSIFSNPTEGILVVKKDIKEHNKSYFIILGKEYWKTLIGTHNRKKVYILTKDMELIYSSKSNDTFIIDNNIFNTEKFNDFFQKTIWGNQGYYFYDTYGKYGRDLVISYESIKDPYTNETLGSVVILLETSKLLPSSISIVVLFITILIGGTILIRLIFKFSEIIIRQFVRISQKFHTASEEKEKIRKKLLISEKLASLGRITSGIAHEIGNPLSSILSMCQILEKQRFSQEQYSRFIPRIKKDAERIDSLIKEFMYSYRDTKANYSTLDVNKVIINTMKMIPKNKKRDDIEIHTDLYKNIPDVLGDIRKLEIAFLNIVLNSFQACDNDGKVYIRTYKQKNYVCISIKDNGKGIYQQDIEKIFDPFYTTKPVGQGSGVGLFICQQIIEAHDGSIKVISSKDKGTEFIIKIPFAEDIGG